jgi:hypothetical protein
VAHANLSPAPLPGYIEEQQGDPYLVSQDESMDYSTEEEFETHARKKGFFERIFGSSDESRAEKRRKRQSKNDHNSIY